MTKLVLVRHGRSTANAAGVLAGRAAGVRLDELGRQQAEALGAILAGSDVVATYCSPIERCLETAQLAGLSDPVIDDRLTECDYGDWTNRPLSELAAEPEWATIQAAPSSVTFPGGESMREMRSRVVAAVADITVRHPEGIVVVVSHGDPIKAILSDALAQDFDDFQRINVAPASVSVVSYGGDRPFVECINANADLAQNLARAVGPVVGGGDVAGE